MGVFPECVTITEESVGSPGGGYEPPLGTWNQT